MITSTVVSASHLHNMPNQDSTAQPVIQVTTDQPAGTLNAFYMSIVDLKGEPIKLPLANKPKDAPVDPDALNFGDTISYDHHNGFHTVVLWKDREIRQLGCSFDTFATPSAAGVGSGFDNDGWSAIQPSVIKD